MNKLRQKPLVQRFRGFYNACLIYMIRIEKDTDPYKNYGSVSLVCFNQIGNTCFTISGN